MAKQKFTHFVPRDKPKKRGPGAHKKNKNKQNYKEFSSFLKEGLDKRGEPQSGRTEPE